MPWKLSLWFISSAAATSRDDCQHIPTCCSEVLVQEVEDDHVSLFVQVLVSRHLTLPNRTSPPINRASFCNRSIESFSNYGNYRPQRSWDKVIFYYWNPTKSRGGDVLVVFVCHSIYRGSYATITPLPIMHWTYHTGTMPAPVLVPHPMYREIPSPGPLNMFKIVQLGSHCTGPLPPPPTCSNLFNQNLSVQGQPPRILLVMLSCST